MADDDAILRQTQRSIDNLFKQVSGSASAASDGLNRVAGAGGAAAGGLRVVSSSAHNLAGSLSQVSSSALNASKGFATCPLNANLTRRNEKLLRRALKIGKGESLVMFIAVGYYEDTFTSPNSNRDDVKDVVKIFP